jgi:hypothetical protein
MTRHIRWGLILFLGVLIAIAGTAPYWLERLEPLQEAGTVQEVFPCPANFDPQICALLEAIDGENPLEAEAMIQSLQSDPVPAPANEATCKTIEDTIDQEAVSLFSNTLVRVGSFAAQDRLHWADGVASLYELVADEEVSRFLCFEEGFEVANGPDLRVYLSINPQPRTAEEVLAKGTGVEISPLKGNLGGQHYQLDDDIDITQFASVVIMSGQYGRVFSSAPLQQPIQ